MGPFAQAEVKRFEVVGDCVRERRRGRPHGRQRMPRGGGLYCPTCGGAADLDNFGASCAQCVSETLGAASDPDTAARDLTEEAADFCAVVGERRSAPDESAAVVIAGTDSPPAHCDEERMLELASQGQDMRRIPNAHFYSRLVSRIAEWPALHPEVGDQLHVLAGYLGAESASSPLARGSRRA